MAGGNEIQLGGAVLWGLSTNGNARIGITGYASIIGESAKAGHKFKTDAIQYENGFDAALIATNGYQEIDVTFFPSKDSPGGFLAPLATATLSNFNGGLPEDGWIYVGDSTIDLSQKAGKVMVKLRSALDDLCVEFAGRTGGFANRESVSGST